MNGFAERIVRAIRLDKTLYEEVEHDKDAIYQSMGVVSLSSVAAGVAALPIYGVAGLFWSIIIAFISWFVWSGIILFVGTKIFPAPTTQSDMGEILRVIGFSSAPGIFRIFGFYEPIQLFLYIACGIWMLMAMVIAVRQALDYLSSARAIWVCISSWLFQVVVFVLLNKIILAFYYGA